MPTDAATEPWDATTLLEAPRATGVRENAAVPHDAEGAPRATDARESRRRAAPARGQPPAALRGEPLVLAAGRASRHYWRDLWRYRELLFFLAWRDLSVRYKQTAIGIAWAVLRPALTMLVFV